MADQETDAVRVDSGNRAHARISASAIKRRMSCPGSMALEKFFPDETSEWAREGTAAHAVLEMFISGQAPGQEVTIDDGPPVPVTGEMLSACRTAVETVNAFRTIGDAFSDGPQRISVEQELTDPDYPDLIGGHADVVMVGDSMIHVLDLKYGVGVAVREPDQLAVYAMLAWLAMSPDARDRVKQFLLTVLQPRLSPEPVTWVWSVEDMQRFRAGILSKLPGIVAIDEAAQSEADVSVEDVVRGDWCQFCKARAVCPAAVEEAIEADELSVRGGVVSMATTDVLLGLLSRKSRIIKFLNSIEDELIRRSLAGQQIPGHKVVERMGNRTIENPDAFLTAMIGQGYDRAELVKESLVSLSELEAAVGKELGLWTTRKISGRSLVEETDPRPSVVSPFDALE